MIVWFGKLSLPQLCLSAIATTVNSLSLRFLNMMIAAMCSTVYMHTLVHGENRVSIRVIIKVISVPLGPSSVNPSDGTYMVCVRASSSYQVPGCLVAQ